MGTGNLRGALLEKILYERIYKVTQKSFQRKIALQAHKRDNHVKNQFFYRTYKYIKRAFLKLSVPTSASVSLEASIAIPIFLFAFLEILSLLSYLSVYSGVLCAIKFVGDPVSVYGYAYDRVMEETEEVSIGESFVTSLVFSETYLDAQVKKACDGALYQNMVSGGAEGITLLGSHIDRADKEVAILAHYTVEPLISFAGTGLRGCNYYYARFWTGYEPEQYEVAEDMVYITEHGTVYHLSRDCTHLQLSIKSIQKSDLWEARNDYGRKYSKCPMCVEKEPAGDYYYITQRGDRYHAVLSCSGLKRTVRCVRRKEVEGWNLCNRCKQREQ